MAAQNRNQLLEVTEREFLKLRKIIAQVPSQHALLSDEEDTSIKDVVAHRAHWIDLFLGWYADGQSGKTVHFPAQGYKWNELKRYNADLRQHQKDVGWAEAVELLHDRYEDLHNFIARHSDHALYGGPMKGGHNHWTTGRWAEAAGASHFRSAGKYIRTRLKSFGS